jgi:hypothetical protein
MRFGQALHEKDQRMSDLQNPTRGEFHAVIREMEPGVFRAEYSGELNPENPDAREFPDFHLGTSLTDVKTWVEQMARSMGYHRVVWDSLPQ